MVGVRGWSTERRDPGEDAGKAIKSWQSVGEVRPQAAIFAWWPFGRLQKQLIFVSLQGNTNRNIFTARGNFSRLHCPVFELTG